MVRIGTTTIAQGMNALDALIKDIEDSKLDWNEAETRLQIIDRIIVDCLGWPRESLRLEQASHDQEKQSFSDYELGRPRCAIWEAKRHGHTFDLPADPQGKIIKDLPSIMALGGEASYAIKQVQNYCSNRGVEVAVATNGRQLIAFMATRNDGTPPLEGRCLVINGYEQLKKHFPDVWQTLSPASISERRLNRFLNVGMDTKLPSKMSSFLPDYPRYRYPSDLQNTLRTLSELLLIDVVDKQDAEKKFYEQCYCESGALSQHALVSKHMLASRYSSLFNLTEKAPNTIPVQSGPNKTEFTPELLNEAISQRPIVLIGDVGVGKTSFLKHLVHISAYNEFQQAIYIYIDLGSQGALTNELNGFVLNEIETQLYGAYEVDIHDNAFVRGVYDLEISRFRRGIYGNLENQDQQAYRQKLMEFLEEKVKHRDRHVKQSIAHIAKGRKKQVIIILDNADQRDYETQQDTFIIAQNFAKDWQAAVFIAVRPQTFYTSKQAGSLTAYPHRVFTIAPPRVDQVIIKRVEFALNMAEGRIRIDRIQDIRLHLVNIAAFLKALLHSLAKSNELIEFLSNITAGNIRTVIDFVAKFIGSANVNAQKIIDIMNHEGRYVIPVHEFWKEALLGEYSYYDPQSSLALNLFDIKHLNPDEHFLLPMILGYLNFEGDHRTSEGFVQTSGIVEEMQQWGFIPETSEIMLRRANNKKLLETPQRVTFDEDKGELYGDMPECFRISTIGAYHLLRWIAEFSYLDAMSYDTPILDKNTQNSLQPNIASFAIEHRLDRAVKFRAYLTDVWNNSNLTPHYFDWKSSLKYGKMSFDRVQRAVERNKKENAS